MKKDRSYRFRLPGELLEAAREKAKRDDLALAQVLRRLLSEYVESEKAPGQPRG